MINALLLSAVMLPQKGTPPDQLKIKDDVVGKGPVAKTGDIVSVDYTGTLINGTQFDSSVGRTPFMFMLGAGFVIKGWDQGVAGMHEGGKRELTVPASLGYGDKVTGAIPANSVLHFSITLLKVEPKVDVTVITPGAGDAVAEVGDVAFLNFTGGIKGGKVIFDSHDNDPKKPIQILIGERTLPIGFASALTGMKQGEKRRVLIPGEIAYGSKGVPAADKNGVKAGSIIPPDSTLDFTFELVKLEKSTSTK